MGIVKDTALKVAVGEYGANFDDRVEALQYINDNGLVEMLPLNFRAELESLIENGVINTDPYWKRASVVSE